MPSRFWEFGIGCLISLIPLDNILFLRRKKLTNIISLGILLIMFVPNQFSFLLRIVIVLFTSIILLNLQKGCFIVKILSAKHIVIIG